MSRIAATTLLALLLLMAGQHARAAEPKVITMSCDGTLTSRVDNVKPEPMKKMGVVVNLDERTVSFLGYVAHIKDVDAANITFGGRRSADNTPTVTASASGAT